MCCCHHCFVVVCCHLLLCKDRLVFFQFFKKCFHCNPHSHSESPFVLQFVLFATSTAFLHTHSCSHWQPACLLLLQDSAVNEHGFCDTSGTVWLWPLEHHSRGLIVVLVVESLPKQKLWVAWFLMLQSFFEHMVVPRTTQTAESHRLRWQCHPSNRFQLLLAKIVVARSIPNAKSHTCLTIQTTGSIDQGARSDNTRQSCPWQVMQHQFQGALVGSCNLTMVHWCLMIHVSQTTQAAEFATRARLDHVSNLHILHTFHLSGATFLHSHLTMVNSPPLPPWTKTHLSAEVWMNST